MKRLLIYVILVIMLLLVSCSKVDSNKNNINLFLEKLYQVTNTSDYEQYLLNIYDSNNEENFQGIKEPSMKDYETFILEYSELCTDECMENLIALGYITKYDKIAWNEKCQLLVNEISVSKGNTKNQYNYKVVVEKKYSDGKNCYQISDGIISTSDDGKISWLKIITELTDK